MMLTREICGFELLIIIKKKLRDIIQGKLKGSFRGRSLEKDQ
jgi:hypothetical protein